MELLLGTKRINANSPVFFIAEIGQNHQGDINIAKKLIDAAIKCGADCVKFQKTDINEKFTESVLKEIYNSPNSWGETYGDHKRYLEFSDEEFLELQQYSNKKGILFTASPMDVNSLQFLLELDVPFLKIGSGEVNNVQLLEAAAKCGKPLVISTGMLIMEKVKKVVEIVKKYCGTNFALLHCVSSYPTPIKDVNLRVISLYKKSFPDVIIGYSGHEIGVNVSVAATVLGAKIIERHITLDKNLKGSDHKCSLLPEQYEEMVRTVREIHFALGKPEKILEESEIPCWEKLGKSIVASKDLNSNHKISNEDLKIKVAKPKGIDGIYYMEILGKSLKVNKRKDDPIFSEDIK